MPIVTPLDETAKAAHIPGHKIAGTQMIGGSTVSQHWNLPDDKDKARKALRTGEIDVLTLSPHLLMPDPAIDKFTALLLEHNPKGRVTVQASWFLDGPGGLKVTPEERDAADPSAFRKSWAFVGDKFREQVRSINETYAAKMHRSVAFLVPSGEAVIRLRERVAKGEVPGIARQSALFRDARARIASRGVERLLPFRRDLRPQPGGASSAGDVKVCEPRRQHLQSQSHPPRSPPGRPFWPSRRAA